ncbi:MAG: hypothetical protein OEL77_00105 [Nitrosopumilus sp.]|nr:hypothetical protein [Nitrosopumilus sp.]MDH3384404.1 hypothetical protein [Nitrosopumilus sp.]
MISFEHRILSEYKIKSAKLDTLVKSILTHRDPKGLEAMEATDFLDVLVNETDQFYEKHSEILSNNGKSPHVRSHLPETKLWNDNIERYFEKHPRRRRK